MIDRARLDRMIALKKEFFRRFSPRAQYSTRIPTWQEQAKSCVAPFQQMRTLLLSLLCFIILFCSIFNLINAKSLYISPDGDDTSSTCDSSAPCKQLKRAFVLSVAGDEIILLPGSDSSTIIVTDFPIKVDHSILIRSNSTEQIVTVRQQLAPECAAGLADCAPIFIMPSTTEKDMSTSSFVLNLRDFNIDGIGSLVAFDETNDDPARAIYALTIQLNNMRISGVMQSLMYLKAASSSQYRYVVMSDIAISDSNITVNQARAIAGATAVLIQATQYQLHARSISLKNIMCTIDDIFFDRVDYSRELIASSSSLISVTSSPKVFLDELSITSCSSWSAIFSRTSAKVNVTSSLFENNRGIYGIVFSNPKSVIDGEFGLANVISRGNVLKSPDFNRVRSAFVANSGFLRYGEFVDTLFENNVLDVIADLEILNVANLINTTFSGDLGTQFGCLRASGTEYLLIQNSTFRACYSKASGGALIFAGDGNLRLKGTLFVSNRAESNGGAISLQYGAIPIYALTDCHFIGNRAGRNGGALSVEGNVNSYRPNLQFRKGPVSMINNEAKNMGGAIFADHVVLSDIFDLTLHDNLADYGGGLAFADCAFLRVDTRNDSIQCSMNRASKAGGCAYLDALDDPVFGSSFSKAEYDRVVKRFGNTALYGPDIASPPTKFRVVQTDLEVDDHGHYVIIPTPSKSFVVDVEMIDSFNQSVSSYENIAAVTFNDGSPQSHLLLVPFLTPEGNHTIQRFNLTVPQDTIPGSVLNLTIGSVTSKVLSALSMQIHITRCGPGYRIMDNNCIRCEPGTYSPGYDDDCLQCPMNSYSEDWTSTQCVRCPWWTVSLIQGSTHQSECYLFSIIVGVLAVISVAGVCATAIPASIFAIFQRVYRLKQQKLVDSLLQNDYLKTEAELSTGSMNSSSKSYHSLSNWSSKFVINAIDIKIGDMIAKGAQGALFVGSHMDSTPVALKIFPLQSFIQGETSSLRDFETEVSMLSQYSHHPNVVRFIGVVELGNKIAIVTELAKCSLAAYIQRVDILKSDSKSLAISFGTKKRILRDIASGLLHLHRNHVAHRDIKPENVLLDEHDTAKLCDFGFSKVLEEQKTKSNNTLNIGTAAYMAPELIGMDRDQALEKGYDMRCDVYSFGILVAALMTETVKPYGDLADQDIIFKVKARDLRPAVEDTFIYQSVKKECDERGMSQQESNAAILGVKELLDMMRKCWSADPLERPTFKEILKLLDKI